tara:strand:- start:585 stop:773 length:189 start_codon:yes stop_codon:yes gene_type:complete
MTPREAAQLEAERTFTAFMGWSKTAFYWILAIVIFLAWHNFGDDGTGSQLNGEVYAPMNISN